MEAKVPGLRAVGAGDGHSSPGGRSAEEARYREALPAGATLALHASEGPHVEGDNPRNSPAGRCRPGLSVPDLYAFHKRMVEKNVPCIQEPKEVFGVRIAQYIDPDGLALSVSEERRDR